MKRLNKKILLSVVALVACLFVSVAFTACFNDSSEPDEERTVTVTFDAGRGTIFGERFYEIKVSEDSIVSEPSKAPVGEEGYLFVGWNETGDERDAMWNFAADKVTGDITLHAVWAREHTVVFDANGGTFAGGENSYSVKVAQNAKLTAPAITPPNDNLVLKGWYYGSTKWDFSSALVRSDIVLSAAWGFTEAIEKALEPFNYREWGDGSCMIVGLKDKNATELVVPEIVSDIVDDAFKNCTGIVSVKIADSVTSIGRSAFEGCSALKNVTLPADLQTLNGSAFADCTALEEILLPETLTSLGGSAFDGCVALQTIDLPAGITRIESATFRDCSALTSVEMKGDITVIDQYAFSGCERLSEFSISATVTKIGDHAFENCKSLTSVTIPAACKIVGWYAFTNCEKLESADLNCAIIDDGAFSGCESLAVVTLGSSVKSIESGAFEKCGLTSLKIPDSVTTLEFAAFGSCEQLESADIGNGITELSWNLFSGCSALRTVTTRGVLTEIGQKTFADCVSLISYTIPATVTKVGGYAFSGCVRLVEIYNLSQASVTGAGFESYCKVHTDANEASVIDYNQSEKLAFFTGKASGDGKEWNYLLDYFGDGEYLTLPDDYNGENYTIFDYALSGRKNLKSVTFSKGVKKIGKNVLLGSDNVTELVAAPDVAAYYSAGNCIIEKAGDKFVLGCRTSVIPDGVKAIGANVFCENANIVNPSFEIPDSVTQIEQGAFDGCEGLIRTAENYIQYVDKWAIAFIYYERVEMFDLVLDDGTVGIAESAMQISYVGRNRISSFKCNPELKYICDYAFYGCGSMTSVTLNDGLISLGHGAFSSCDSLLEIDIPDSVGSIGAAAFMNCNALTYVKLPSGLKTIEYQMFDGCAALETVVIPASVSHLKHDVFGNCAKAVVYFEGTSEQWAAVRKDNGNTVLAVRYYSETENAGFWHYGADGKPVLW
ncbi:leucine-rich repeat protein [Pumilibacter muris]|uniref:leucine-rich repeat protein n=1 Tax=Pumilibacter muris TaxID=2941510 RepID=UPI002042259F|nr:leucine-rich repeat protein [Pumilibacter muris]